MLGMAGMLGIASLRDPAFHSLLQLLLWCYRAAKVSMRERTNASGRSQKTPAHQDRLSRRLAQFQNSCNSEHA
jgi:hypothetical protein